METIIIMFVIWAIYSLYDENIGNDNKNWKSDWYQKNRKRTIERGEYYLSEHEIKMHKRFGYIYDKWFREYDLYGTLDCKWPSVKFMKFSSISIYYKIPEETIRERYKISESLWKELNRTHGKCPYFLYPLIQRLADEDFRDYSRFFPKERPVIDNLDLEEIVGLSGLEEDVFMDRYFSYNPDVYDSEINYKKSWVDPILLRLQGLSKEDNVAILALLERVVIEDTFEPWCDYTKWGKGYYEVYERNEDITVANRVK